VILAGSKIYITLNFINVKNLKTCIAVGYSMAKYKRSNVTNGLDTSQNKAVNLAG